MTRKSVINWTLAAMCVLLPWSASAANCTLGQEGVLDLTKRHGLSFFLDLGGPGYVLVNAMRQAEVVDVFNVSGRVERRVGESIVKAELVTLSEGSSLVFTDMEAPFWAIVAQELRLHTESGAKTRIYRDPDYVLEQPQQADDGDNGKTLGRHDTDHGQPGEPGSTGVQGEPGESRNLPCLFVIARNVVFQDGSTPQDLTLDLRGIAGGDGGQGGKGGDGARGQAGNHADDHWLNCRNEAGDGGRGGDGGDGGKGGRAGRGGDGGSVVFVGDLAHGRDFLSSKLLQEPGKPGNPGRGGGGGKPGDGGDDGSRNGVCQRDADEGDRGDPGESGAEGAPGAPGNRGRALIVSVGDTQVDQIMQEVFRQQ